MRSSECPWLNSEFKASLHSNQPHLKKKLRKEEGTREERIKGRREGEGKERKNQRRKLGREGGRNERREGERKRGRE